MHAVARKQDIFSKAHASSPKHVPLERWIQHMIGVLKTVSLAWVNKVTVIGCTWLFFAAHDVNVEILV